jgi:hypothetical protein
VLERAERCLRAVLHQAAASQNGGPGGARRGQRRREEASVRARCTTVRRA